MTDPRELSEEQLRDLVRKLRVAMDDTSARQNNARRTLVETDIPALLSHIASQAATIARLRAALEPWVSLGVFFNESWADSDELQVCFDGDFMFIIEVGDIRAALALSKEPQP